MSTNRGVLYVHSTPSALCPHIEWAAGGLLGVPVRLDWTAQPAEPSTYRADYTWQGPSGTAARLASKLQGWRRLRFEVTEESNGTGQSERYAYTPSLGIFRATTGPHGDILVEEDRIREAILQASLGRIDLATRLSQLIGEPWDDELEAFRYAGEGASVRWLHKVV